MEESNHFKKHNASNFTSILIMKYQQLYVALFGQNMFFKLVVSDQANNRQIYWGTYDHQGCQDSENVENLFDSLIKQKAVVRIEENKLNVMIETEEKLIEVCKIDLKREKSNKIKTGLSLFSKKKKNEQKYRIALEKLEAIPPRSSMSWVSRSCRDYERLILEENRIKTKEEILEIPIDYPPFREIYGSTILTGVFRYKISLNKFCSGFNHIWVGISDIENMNEKKNDNIFAYIINSEEIKHLYNNNNNNGNDYICVTGSINDGIIEISINNKFFDRYFYEEMLYYSVKWVPMLKYQMYSEISILETFTSKMLLEFFLAVFWFEWDDDIMSEIHNIIIVFEKNDEIEYKNYNKNDYRFL